MDNLTIINEAINNANDFKEAYSTLLEKELDPEVVAMFDKFLNDETVDDSTKENIKVMYLLQELDKKIEAYD